MPSTSVRVARDSYFAANGFSEADYRAPVLKIKLGPVAVPFPNRPARQRVVGMHDLHHLATGYDTSWIGEGEQAAWELGAGCGRHLTAWALDLGAFGAGLALAPRRVFAAFVRGRHGAALYREAAWDEAWLDLSVDELRARLGCDQPPPAPTAADRLAFVALAAAALSPISMMLVAAAATM